MAKRKEMQAPIFSKGMTWEQAVEYIKGRIEKNKICARQGWSDDDKLIRHQIILSMLGKNGISNLNISRQLQNMWNIGHSSADSYVREALHYLTENSETYREYARDMQVDKLQELIKECAEKGKYKEAMMGMEQLNKIFGVYQDNKKVEVKTETTKPIVISFGE
jgi:hypothetical protein